MLFITQNQQSLAETSLLDLPSFSWQGGVAARSTGTFVLNKGAPAQQANYCIASFHPLNDFDIGMSLIINSLSRFDWEYLVFLGCKLNRDASYNQWHPKCDDTQFAKPSLPTHTHTPQESTRLKKVTTSTQRWPQRPWLGEGQCTGMKRTGRAPGQHSASGAWGEPAVPPCPAPEAQNEDIIREQSRAWLLQPEIISSYNFLKQFSIFFQSPTKQLVLDQDGQPITCNSKVNE